MSKSRSGLIVPATIILLVIGWVLVLIPSLTSASNALSLATVTSGDRVPATFGILSWDGGSFGRARSNAFRTNNGATVGYQAVLEMPFELPNPINSTLPPDLSNRPYTVTSAQNTEPLVLLPVSLGLLALGVILFMIGAARSSSGWIGFAALFSSVGAILAWAGWGHAIQLAPTIRRSLVRYADAAYAVLDEVNVQRGNAIWPGLVGAILVTVASILMIVKLATRPSSSRKHHEEMSETALKTQGARHGSTSSDSTVV